MQTSSHDVDVSEHSSFVLDVSYRVTRRTCAAAAAAAPPISSAEEMALHCVVLHDSSRVDSSETALAGSVQFVATTAAVAVAAAAAAVTAAATTVAVAAAAVARCPPREKEKERERLDESARRGGAVAASAALAAVNSDILVENERDIGQTYGLSVASVRGVDRSLTLMHSYTHLGSLAFTRHARTRIVTGAFSVSTTHGTSSTN